VAGIAAAVRLSKKIHFTVMQLRPDQGFNIVKIVIKLFYLLAVMLVAKINLEFS